MKFAIRNIGYSVIVFGRPFWSRAGDLSGRLMCLPAQSFIFLAMRLLHRVFLIKFNNFPVHFTLNELILTFIWGIVNL